MEEVISLLLGNGWTEDGRTKEEIVRVSTTKSPVLGGIGGKPTRFGGRLRFSLPGTQYKVTVGKITTYFYKTLGGGQTQPAARFETRNEFELIKKFVEETKAEYGND